MDASYNKRKGAVKMNNGRSADPLLEMSPNLVAWAGQTSNNSTFVEKAHQVESLEDVPETYLSEKDEGVIGASTLRKPVEMLQMPHCVNITNRYSQHARLGTIGVKAKPNISLRRDVPILPHRTAVQESLQNVIDIPTDMSKQPLNSMSSEKRRIRLPKPHKEEVQECNKHVVGCNVSSTKIRSSKDVSSRASTQLKPYNLSRSLSPALIVDQRSQQVRSKERSTNDYKNVKPEMDCLRQNPKFLKQISSGSKSTNTSAQASKAKLEHSQTEDHDNKNVIHKTDDGVSRVEDPAISPASSQNGSRGDRHQAEESFQLQSPVSVASSMSDTYVRGPKKQLPQSVARAVKKASDRATIEKRRENQAEFLRKANFDEIGDTHNKSDSNDNLPGYPRSAISRRDLKPEARPSSHKVRHDVDQRIRNQTVVTTSATQQQMARDRKLASSLKWNASVKAANANKYNDKVKIAGKRGNGFPRDCMEESKQDKTPVTKVHTRTYNSTSDSFSSSHGISERGEGPFGSLVKTKHRAGKTDKETSDWSMTDCSYKKEQTTESHSANAETHMYTVFDQAGPSSNVVSLETLVQSVSAAQSFCPCSRDDLVNTRGLNPDLTQGDILPVIYFCWQKCTDPRSDQGTRQQDLQQVLSLDQGLSLFRQIMLDATSEDTVYSQEYTLNQLIINGEKSIYNCDVINSNKQKIGRGTCFQLTPKCKRVKSNTIIWSSESTSTSTLTGLFNGNSTYFSQESRHAMLLENKDEKHSLSPALGVALCGINDIQTAINISKAIKNSIQRRLNMASLWSSVTSGITAFFLYPLEKPSIAYSRLCAGVRDNNGTTVDDINSVLDNGRCLEDSQPPEQLHDDTVVASELPTPVAGQQSASPEHVITEQRKSPRMNLIAEKRKSQEKATLNDTSSTDEPSSACAGSNTRLKSVPCTNTKVSGKHTPAVTHTLTASNQLLQHRLDRWGNGTTISANFRMDTHKERSHYIHSNTPTVNSIRSEKTDRNELNNIPFSIQVYESLEGPPMQPDCDHIYGQQNGVEYRTYENDELEFMATSENCPDPALEDLENMTDSHSTARISGYGPANRRQYPHLVWTMRYGQSMLDSGGQPDVGSTCCTSNERAEVNDGNGQPHKQQQGDSGHAISGQDHIQEPESSAHDASNTGFNFSIGTEVLCRDACHSYISQIHAPVGDDVNTISGNATASRQQVTSSYVLNDVPGHEDSDVSVNEVLSSIHKQPISSTDTGISSSPAKTNEEIKWRGHIKDADLPEYVCSDKNEQISHVDSHDNDTSNGRGYSETPYRKDVYHKCIDEDTGCLCELAPNAEDRDPDRNLDDDISETHSRKTKTADTSQPTVEHAVSILTRDSSDLDTVTLNTACKKEPSEVAIELNDPNWHFPGSLSADCSQDDTVNTATGTLVPPKVLSSPGESSVNNISTDESVQISSEGSMPAKTTSKQNLQWFSIGNITRAALALKEVSSSRMSYLCSSQTATACSYLIRVGCNRPLGDTLSNLICTQQLSRCNNSGMLDQCGSSVDERTLICKTEGLIENRAYDEDKHNLTLNNSFENGNMDNNVPTSFVYVDQNIRNENVNATIANDSPEYGSIHQKRLETLSSPTELSGILPEMTGLNYANQTAAKTDTIELLTSFNARVSPMTTQSNNTRINNCSNSSQTERNKAAISELHLPRITDLLAPSACQSDEGQESGIFSNYSLASPPVPQTADMDNANSSLESFESVFTKNSVYLKEQTSRNDQDTGLSTAD